MAAGNWIWAFVLATLMIVSPPKALAEEREVLVPVGDHSVWLPSEEALNEMRKVCLDGEVPDRAACIGMVMQRWGATPEAAVFTRMTSSEAFLVYHEEVGRVDVGYVVLPFRANENQGAYLVNGDPPVLDVDDLQWLDVTSLEGNSDYLALREEYPQVTLWPGDRSPDGFLSFRNFEDGGQQFVFNYRLRDGCHACALIGIAVFAFDFDSEGRFTESNLMQAIPARAFEASKSLGTSITPQETDGR